MANLNIRLEQVQLLIDRIQNHYAHDLKFNKYNYDKLLTLSERIAYPYGQALAHVYLAGHFQMLQDDETYHFHLDTAANIARHKNYFDVLMEYYRIKGQEYIHICDEITALSMYLEGLKIAIEINDGASCAMFYNYIGETFYISGASEDAVQYYLKAVDAANGVEGKAVEFNVKTSYICLTHIYCAMREKEKAAQYCEAARNVPCKAAILPLLYEEAEIRILLLESNREKALQKTEQFIEGLERKKGDAVVLKPVYLVLMELLLSVEHKAYAKWCMDRMDELYRKTHQNTRIRIKELHVHYAELFGIEDSKCYEDFYFAMQEGEAVTRKTTGESLKNLIALYEAEKEHDRIAEERTDLQTAVNTDELTGISNRRYLSKLVSKMLQDKQIDALGYIMVDVDFFKEYNDYYGHSKGDLLLVEVARILNANLPEEAYAARYGGDEFSCLFINKSDEEIVAFVRRVQKEVKDRGLEHMRSGISKSLTLSFGIYNEKNLRDEDVDMIVKKADKALYQAKKQGRNTFAIYS